MITIRRCCAAAALLLTLGAADAAPAAADAEPTVELTAPADGAVVSGDITVTATATDDVAVQSVTFYFDGGLPIGQDSSAPYTTSLVTTSYSAGTHEISATATDSAGHTSAVAFHTIVIDNTTPVAEITSGPPDGAHVAAGVAPTYAYATSDGESGIGSVQCGLQGLPLDTCPQTGSRSFPGLAAGTYVFELRATDRAGNPAITAREFIVDGPPSTPTTPTVTPTTTTVTTTTTTATTAQSAGATTAARGPTPIVTRPPAPPAVVRGVRRAFRVTSGGTRITTLAVEVLGSSKVVAACRGGGCAFKRKTARVRNGAADVAALFGRKRTLRAGARLVVTVTAPDGRVATVSVAFRRGKPPTVTLR